MILLWTYTIDALLRSIVISVVFGMQSDWY